MTWLLIPSQYISDQILHTCNRKARTFGVVWMWNYICMYMKFMYMPIKTFGLNSITKTLAAPSDFGLQTPASSHNSNAQYQASSLTNGRTYGLHQKSELKKWYLPFEPRLFCNNSRGRAGTHDRKSEHGRSRVTQFATLGAWYAPTRESSSFPFGRRLQHWGLWQSGFLPLARRCVRIKILSFDHMVGSTASAACKHYHPSTMVYACRWCDPQVPQTNPPLSDLREPCRYQSFLVPRVPGAVSRAPVSCASSKLSRCWRPFHKCRPLIILISNKRFRII